MAQQPKTMADVQKIKEEFIELHNQVPELISDDALEPLLALVKDTKGDRERIATGLKTSIKHTLLKEFEEMWKSQNFDVHLAILEEAKKQYAGREHEKAWRPTGKPPKEQVSAIESGVLKSKIAYLEDLINEQRDELKEVLPEVVSNREKMENLLKQRQTTLKQLQNHHVHYKEALEEVEQMKKKMADKIMEVSSK